MLSFSYPLLLSQPIAGTAHVGLEEKARDSSMPNGITEARC